MSRSCYSDDYGDDFPGQLELYRANVRRSIRSRKGQARLLELRDALLAMPVKELHQDVFVTGSEDAPKVCALGAWALGKGFTEASKMVVSNPDDSEIAAAMETHGWPRLVVMDAVYFNDDGVWGKETPAERHRRMLAWVEENIIPADPQP